MFRIGAHVSSSGSVVKTVERAKKIGGNCGQLFVGSPRTWSVGDVSDEDAAQFKQAVEEEDIRPWIVHGTYLINLGTPKDDLGEKSVKTVQQELDAAAKLGIPYYTFHPGAHTGAGTEQGLENAANRISQLDIPDETMLLLENTAGKGTTLGKTFEDLQTMIEQSTYGHDKVGVCLDTCHLYAAGYDFTTAEGVESMIDELDDDLGVENVHYLHLNDSKHPLGSEKDEHQHIGEGKIGDDGFKQFINHPALRDKPMALETPVTEEKGYAWNIRHLKEDIRNIEKAKDLRE